MLFTLEMTYPLVIGAGLSQSDGTIVYLTICSITDLLLVLT